MTSELSIENSHYKVTVGEAGCIASIRVKAWQEDLIKEPRLANNFKISLPVDGRMDHYIVGSEQQIDVVRKSDSTLVLHCDSLRSELGEFAIEADFFIDLIGNRLRFTYEIRNGTPHPLAEIWYPMIGGMTGVGERLDTEFVAPGYTGEIRHNVFQHFVGGYFAGGYLGTEDAVQEFGYPGLPMPWLSIYNPKRNIALYVAEHNEIQRRMSFVFEMTPSIRPYTRGTDRWPAPDEVDDDAPVGVTMSKVAYPHTKQASFTSGQFVLQAHDGDWHRSAKLYRDWFMDKFPFDKSDSWLRKEQAWFTSIIYQPEDRLIATHREYADWMKDAADIGITTGELIGWDKGGLERGYPEYVPEDKLGGWEGYRDVLKGVHEAGAKLLTFVNYQILDSCTDWYKEELHKYRRMDSFGQTENWMGWGESTLKARVDLDVRRHVPVSVSVPGFSDMLDPYLTKLVEEGSDGLQIDKVCVQGKLDFNPHHDRDPDLPMCEDLVRAIGNLYDKCVRINPNFCMASEASTDRFIPYADVFYRAATADSISTLRYVFPEWTSCVHISSPFDYISVNGAMMLGAVLVVEPFNYTRPVSHPAFRRMAGYIGESLRLRKQYMDRIFLADYLDKLDAEVEPVQAESADDLSYRVHARHSDGKRAIVVVNASREPIVYRYRFTHKDVSAAVLARPFSAEQAVGGAGELTLEGERWHVILEQ